MASIESLVAGIKNHEQKMAVVGMGYVGMPLALAFGKVADVIGFDINASKIALYQKGIDPTDEVGDKAIQESGVTFSSDEADLEGVKLFVIAVPTPVKQDETPDLSPLESASAIVGEHLSPGSLVVYESTVYPGVTENICAPVLESFSSLICGKDFKIGYSPERINPGDKVHRLENIVKIVSGMDEETLDQVAELYEMIIEAGVHRVRSIKTAEAAKVTENTQRDINIAFVNELAMAFDRMGIDTLEVLDAAATKWNFLNFRPGLVGGHCIGVDPYYFIYEAKNLGYNSMLIGPGRHINNEIARFIADKAVKLLVGTGHAPKSSNVYIFGATFKENCPDIRNSKVFDICKALRAYQLTVKIVEPVAELEELRRTYDETFVTLDEVKNADCILFTVAHDLFRELTAEQIKGFFREGNPAERIVMDIKGICDKKALTDMGYTFWRL